MQYTVLIRHLSRASIVVLAIIPLIVAYMGALQIRAIAERTERTAAVISSLHAFSDQRIRLYQIALAAKPDSALQQKIETAFNAYRAEKGTLTISDSSVAQIVSIPEIRTNERQPYSWRVFVPDTETVQVVVAEYESYKDEVIEASEELYAKTLPKGESVIQWIWVDGNEGRLKQRGLLGAPRDAGLKLVVNADEHRFFPPSPWPAEFMPSSGDSGVKYGSTNSIFVDCSQVKLANVYIDGVPLGNVDKGVQLWLRKITSREISK